jgi:hypothetical protein
MQKEFRNNLIYTIRHQEEAQSKKCIPHHHLNTQHLDLYRPLVHNYLSLLSELGIDEKSPAVEILLFADKVQLIC